jgi:hypothetical protein
MILVLKKDLHFSIIEKTDTLRKAISKWLFHTFLNQHIKI